MLTSLLAPTICALVGATLYLNTLSCGFVHDDEKTVVSNQLVKPENSWQLLLTHDFWGVPMHDSSKVLASHTQSFRPVTSATYKLQAHYGHSVYEYHFVNIILYGLTCFLYCSLIQAILSLQSSAFISWTAKTIPTIEVHCKDSLLAGLLFATHPAHCESVANITGRAEILGGLFFFCSVLAGIASWSSKSLLAVLLAVTSFLFYPSWYA